MPFERLRRRYASAFRVPLSDVVPLRDALDGIAGAHRVARAIRAGATGVYAPSVGVVWVLAAVHDAT